ncbi:hypothetical protein J8F10_37465 [Gemmata sp. G18]|uniref:CopG family transcriptional regulator n=1 Tax=Gemmata palustris TaxID=2822762 RepID=A0ABS5C529_9BACT|nr:hypothetical protein [Gemmata palustris]MBP3960945.1 hypothetical protein [Gemmata palustris]
MVSMAKKPSSKASATEKKKRHTIFITLDDETEERLQRFLKSQRVTPDRAAVGLTAILEFLDRVEAEKK